MDSISKQTTLRIEIDPCTLAKILRSRNIAAADIRCLDTHSKQQLRRLCLQACTGHD